MAANLQSRDMRLDRPGAGEVDTCLRQLLGAGVRVSSVETRREDLERLFLDRLGAASADGESQTNTRRLA